MSPIRPTTIAPQPATSPASNSAVAARAAFFEALGGAAQSAPVTPAAAPAPTRNTVTAPAQFNPAEPPARPLRPGSLLDIRV